jgi:tripartite-type tricarboxylate transporter receptor subunit TctC
MRFFGCLNGVAAGIATLAFSILPCPGQPGYAARPITMIVPFPAGGPSDTIARITAVSMSKTLGQPIIIENVAGAGGTLGTARAARALPDGYTLLLHHIGLATAATLYRKLPYDTRTALTPIGLVTEAPMTIVGRSDLAPNTMAELIEYLKTNGDTTTLAHAGLGSASQLCGLLLTSALGRSLTAIPYKGGAPLMNDLLARQVDLACDQATSSIAQIAAKKVKAYAVTVDARLKLMPDLPTVAEAGLKGFSVSVWHGVYAPRGTPAEIVQRISVALNAALSDDDVARRFGELSTDPVVADRRTPRALSQMLLSEIDRWEPIIKAAGQFADY